MLNRRRDDIEAFLKHLTKNEGTDQVQVGDATKILWQAPVSKNSETLASLVLSIPDKESCQFDFRIRPRYCSKVHRSRRTPFGEVFAGEGGIAASIDGPVERFPDAASLCGRCGSRRNQKAS